MIQSVHKAMRILSVISDGKNQPVTLMEIASATGYPKPTCAHILQSLCMDGYVERISHSEGYRLGLNLHHLTRFGRYDQELVTLCRPVLKWMEKNSNATALLSVIQNNQKFIIDNVDTGHRIFDEYQQVRKDDIYRTATGRAILAQMDLKQVKEIYQKYGNPEPGDWDEVQSFDELCRQLDIIRMQKIIIADGSPGKRKKVIGYACPIFRQSTCVGAVGLGWRIPGEKDEAFKDQEEKIKNILLKGKKEIQRRLDYDT